MKAEKELTLDVSRAINPSGMDRREFLKRVGGGIIVFVSLGDMSMVQAQNSRRRKPKDFNAYIRIGVDGRVTCYAGKIEMGSGVMTSIPQFVAEELEVSVDSVDMVMGDTDLCPFDAGTWGSMTTPYLGPPLRAAGAEAKAVLLELAAEHLGVSQDRLRAENGVISDRSNSAKKVTYGQLAKGKKIERHLEHTPELKKMEDFKVIGKSLNRRDAKPKVTGEAQYAGDIRVPGMMYASIVRPAAHGAKLKHIETEGAAVIPGIEVVRDGDLVAVLHALPDVAAKALEKVKVRWDVPKAAFDDKTVFDYFVKHADKGDVMESEGDIAEGEKLADIIVNETYMDSYVAHSPIETHTALAQFEGDKLTVWASTQTPFGLRSELGNELDMPTGKIRVIAPFLGGAFGGKIDSGQAIQAARIARKAQKPVMVAWSRADEFFYDTQRPVATIKVKSGVTKAGKIVSWHYGAYGCGGRGADVFYDIPHYHVVIHEELDNGEDMHPLPIGPWRAPDNPTNGFAREQQMQAMAEAAGMDPVEFRLKNLRQERMIKVLKVAADRFGWTPAKTPSGRGYGVALGTDIGAFIAMIAEAEVNERTGKVQVKRIVCAQDIGLVVNPEGAILQMEGCMVQGLGYALTEEVRFKGGDVITKNFDTYELPRFSWVPKIEAVLVGDDKPPALGGGEPAIVTMGGAIANAIYDATGARLRVMPMNRDRVKEALAKRA